MIEVQVGDEVRIFWRYNRNTPPGGMPGKVVAVRRTLFDVEYGDNWVRTETFRLDTGNLNQQDTSTHVKTVELAERDLRYGFAMERLHEHKITVKHGNKLTLEQLEALVALLDKFEDEEAA